MNRLRALAIPLTLTGTIVMAGSALGRIYVNELLVYLVIGAGLLSVAVGALLRNRSAALLPPVHIALLFGYTLVCVLFTAGRATIEGTFADIYLDAVRNSVPRLLTSMIPVEPQPDTVLVPVVATWAVGLLAAEFGIRYRRVLLGYLPAVLLYGFSLYLVGPNAAGSVWYALGFAGLAGIGLSASAVEPEAEGTVIRADRKTRMRAVTTGAAGAVVLVVGVVAIGPLAGGAVTGKPFDPREYVVPPQLTDVDSNPLIRMSGWAQNPDQPLFTTKMSADARLRLAVLNDYDGVTWKIGQTYRAAGRVLSPPDTTIGPTTEISQQITIGELTGRLTPAVPDPVRVEGMRVAYDKETGTLMNPSGLVRGMTYTVTSQLAAPQVNRLATASVGSGDAIARFLALPGQLPKEITDLAEFLNEQGGGPYQRATNLETFLATHYAFNAKAASGHTLPNLKFFLGTPPRGGGQMGTSEQFAATFGVVGRLLGLPTRVVVGFRAAEGEYTVRGGDAIAWPEVYFEGLGWQAFNPMPQPDETITPPEQEMKPPEETKPPSSSAPPQNYDDPAASAPSDSGEAAPGTAPAQAGAIPAWVFAAGSAAVILLAAIITVLTMKRARTQRRLWTGDAVSRVRGAWRETYDAMRQARRRPPPSLTATEVAGFATAALGGRPGPSLSPLVDAVNEVTFAAEMVRPEVAEAAARAARDYTAALRAARPGWRRLVWTLTPRPLFWKDAPLPKTDR